jgi:hypothetical protein
MAISKSLNHEKIGAILLDPQNPRLGRHNVEKNLSQDQILKIMERYTLDELVVSFLESGFWPQEALLVVEERLPRKTQKSKIVVEGNHRLAALKLIDMAIRGETVPSWVSELVEEADKSRVKALLDHIPYLLVDDRDDVAAYLGFRHVTGIKQWDPAEKAEYISKLIDKKHMSYQEVMRKIGSKVPAVRQHYISYRILLQMEDEEGIDVKSVEEKFSVLYLSLRTQGVQKYLQIDIKADPDRAKLPVPKEQLEHLKRFATWLFGNKQQKIRPVITDSRDVDGFARLLVSERSLNYMERTAEPKFDVAIRLAGVEEHEVREMIDRASDSIEEALGVVHHHSDSRMVRKAVDRLGRDTLELLNKFPHIKEELFGEGNSARPS